MLNLITLVGRLTSDPQINEVEGKKVCIVTLAVPRSFKNENGETEIDFIDIVLWNGIADSVVEYCEKGDLLGVRGRLQTTQLEDKKITEVIAEKITFLSTAKQKQEEE